MAEVLYDQAKVTAYRASAAELHALGREVKQRFDSAVIEGDKQAAREAPSVVCVTEGSIAV